jgi:hypothetical protein
MRLVSRLPLCSPNFCSTAGGRGTGRLCPRIYLHGSRLRATARVFKTLAEGAKRENAPEQEPKDAARVEGHPFSILTAIAGNEEKLELAFEGEVIESLRGGIRAVSDRSPAVRRSVEGHAPRPTLGQVGTFGQCLSFATAPKLRDSADSGGLMVAGLTR